MPAGQCGSVIIGLACDPFAMQPPTGFAAAHAVARVMFMTGIMVAHLAVAFAIAAGAVTADDRFTPRGRGRPGDVEIHQFSGEFLASQQLLGPSCGKRRAVFDGLGLDLARYRQGRKADPCTSVWLAPFAL